MESFVAIMALVAASIIEPGLYFAMNTPPAGLGITMPNLHEMGGENAPIIMAQLKDVTAHAAATVSSWGFVISPEQILQTAKDIGEPSVLNRAGGAPTLAVGIAHVFHKVMPMATWASGITSVFCSKPVHPDRAGCGYPFWPLYAARPAG